MDTIHLEKKLMHAIFHHLLITELGWFERFSKVQGFSVLLLFLISLDLYTNFKHSHSAPAHTVGEGVGDFITCSDVM